MSPSTVARTTPDTTVPRTSRAGRASRASSAGSERPTEMVEALRALPKEEQRFAVILTHALREVAAETDISEDRIRNILYRLVQAGQLQERRAPEARNELARALGPSLADLDPVPYATVEQARRLSALRSSLLRQGAFSTAKIAEGRGIAPNNARQWISRHRRANRLFTVSYERETLVPAFLLSEALEPKPTAKEAIAALRAAGEDGWALWAWFATPSAWLGGRVPAEVLETDPESVTRGAQLRAESAA